ncbi:MAG: TolC family protein [Phycisphaerales bacterium]
MRTAVGMKRMTLTTTALALAAGCAGCAGPLGTREEDLGERVSLSRLRDVQPLGIEQFRSASVSVPPMLADGAAGRAGGPGGGGGGPISSDAMLRPKSRFEGMEVVDLSLDQVRMETLRRNLNLQVALVDPAIAGATLEAERAKFNAVFRPRLSYSDNDNATFDATQTSASKNWSGGAAVDIPLRTGGRASVNLTGGKFDQATTLGNPFSQFYTTDLTFSLSQPLLRNAGEDVTTASIQIASYNEQIAQANTKLSVIAQLAAADRAYWRLYAVRRALDVAQQQYELARTQLEVAERRVRAGDSAEIEVTRAQSGLASRLEAIIVAENAVLQAQRELKKISNMADLDVESTQTIKPMTPPELVAYDLDEGGLIALALVSRMELLEAELQILSDATNERFARNQILPILNLDASYSYDAIGTNFGRATQQLRDRQFQSFFVGGSGEIPLGNEAAENRLNRAVLTRVQRIGNKQAREQTVKQEVLDAVDRVRAGWQRILAARQAAILAGRTLMGEQRQFEVGNRTSTDVLDAAARLADAQAAEIRAFTDYEISQVDLAVATGTVLGQGNVSWSPRGPEILDADAKARKIADDNAHPWVKPDYKP